MERATMSTRLEAVLSGSAVVLGVLVAVVAGLAVALVAVAATLVAVAVGTAVMRMFM